MSGTNRGLSALWPEVNVSFLSLQGLPSSITPQNRAQGIFRDILLGFDSLISCEVKDFYKFNLALQRFDVDVVTRPELRLIQQAFVAWVNFEHDRAEQRFVEHMHAFPTDVVAMFFLHMFQFCTGRTKELVPVLERCDVAMSPEHELHSFYLSTKSFVLCEAERFDQALAVGLEAVRLCPFNIYGIHAVVHALHERSRWDEIITYLEAKRADWVDNVGMRMHVSWHLAIAYERAHREADAMKSFRDLCELKDSPFAKQDLDAVGFLWRWRLTRPDDRQFDPMWRELSVLWVGSVGTSMSYFHKMHAAMAFAATDQLLLIRKLIADSDGFGTTRSTHETGLEVLQAILALAEGRPLECYTRLNRGRSSWYALGGSRAQRELLSLTMEHARRRCVAPNGEGGNDDGSSWRQARPQDSAREATLRGPQR